MSQKRKTSLEIVFAFKEKKSSDWLNDRIRRSFVSTLENAGGQTGIQQLIMNRDKLFILDFATAKFE